MLETGAAGSGPGGCGAAVPPGADDPPVPAVTAGTTLAVEADKTIMLDRDDIRRFAEKNKLTVVAIREGEIPEAQE